MSGRSSGSRSPGWPGRNADVARLAEFARITGTLLIDPDGVYDPADVNDRVLLGFKGTMGEMELHVMAAAAAGEQAGRGRARRAAHPAAGRLRPRRRRRCRDRPRCRGPGRDPDVFAAFAALRVGLRRGRRVRRPPVPAARLRRGVGRAAALGAAHPRPGAGGAEEPGLRRGVRVRPLHLPPHRRPGRHGAHRDRERPRAEWPVLIKDHHEGYITWPDYLANEARLAANRTNAGARPPREGMRAVPGHHQLRQLRQADAHQLPHRRPAVLRMQLPPRPADHARPAGRSPPPPWTTRSPRGCWPRSPPSRSPWRCRRRRRGRRPAPARQPGRRAGRRTRPLRGRPRRARLPRRSNRRTGWSPAAWKPAGRTGSPPSPRPSRPWPPPRTRCRRCPAGPSWRHSPPTCPGSGTRPTTTNKDRKRLLRTLIADITLLPEPDRGKVPDRDPLAHRRHRRTRHRPGPCTPAPPGAPRPPQSTSSAGSDRPPATTSSPPAQRRRPDHRPRPALRRQGRPVDPPRLQHPRPAPYADGEITRRRGRPPARAAAPASSTTGSRTAQLDARRGPGGRLCIPWTRSIEAACRRRIAESGHLNPAARRTRPRNRPQRHEAAAVTVGTA